MPTNYYDEWGQKPPPRAGQTGVTSTAPWIAPSSPGGPAPVVAPSVSLSSAFTTPDYKALIQSDPAYLAWQNNGQLDLNQAAAQRKAALQALAVGYGGIGGNFKDVYGDIGPDTLALAGGNQQSDIARLGRSYTQGVDAFKRSLAARGGLQSGELGYGMDQADMARASSEYDLGREFSNAAQNAINGYLGTESGVRRDQTAALQAAQANQLTLGAAAPADSGTGAATLVPDWEKQYGQPVYLGPDGSLYVLDSNGNPVPYEPEVLSQGDLVNRILGPTPSTTPYLPPIYQEGTIPQPGVAYAA